MDEARGSICRSFAQAGSTDAGSMSRHLHLPTNPYLLIVLPPAAATIGTIMRILLHA
jgi:hypothetical protein